MTAGAPIRLGRRWDRWFKNDGGQRSGRFREILGTLVPTVQLDRTWHGDDLDVFAGSGVGGALAGTINIFPSVTLTVNVDVLVRRVSAAGRHVLVPSFQAGIGLNAPPFLNLRVLSDTDPLPFVVVTVLIPGFRTDATFTDGGGLILEGSAPLQIGEGAIMVMNHSPWDVQQFGTNKIQKIMDLETVLLDWQDPPIPLIAGRFLTVQPVGLFADAVKNASCSATFWWTKKPRR